MYRRKILAIFVIVLLINIDFIHWTSNLNQYLSVHINIAFDEERYYWGVDAYCLGKVTGKPALYNIYILLLYVSKEGNQSAGEFPLLDSPWIRDPICKTDMEYQTSIVWHGGTVSFLQMVFNIWYALRKKYHLLRLLTFIYTQACKGTVEDHHQWLCPRLALEAV